MTNSLINEHIKTSIDQYEEPERKKVPKGDPIGIFKNKFATAMLSLTKMKQKDIAALLDISFGTVRNWFSQDDFQDFRYKRCYEFSSILVPHIQIPLRRYLKRNKDWREGRIKRKPQEPKFPELRDINNYSECIFDFAWEIINKPYIKTTGKGDKTKIKVDFGSMSADELIVYLETCRILFGWNPNFEKYNKLFFTNLITNIISRLKKHDLSREDSEIIKDGLLAIKDYIGGN